jgi:tetratricopeptide (TPR) repeat protein
MRHVTLIPIGVVIALACHFFVPPYMWGEPLEEEDLSAAAPARTFIPDYAPQRELLSVPRRPEESREQMFPTPTPPREEPTSTARSFLHDAMAMDLLKKSLRERSAELSHSAAARRAASTGTSDLPAEEDVLSPPERIALRFVGEGKEALAQQNFERARERLDRAISLAPLQPYGYYFLGRVALAQGELKHALAFLQKAELLFPRDEETWLGETSCLRGIVAEDMGSYDLARGAYQQCLRFVPNNVRALSALARLPEKEPVFDESVSRGVLSQ